MNSLASMYQGGMPQNGFTGPNGRQFQGSQPPMQHGTFTNQGPQMGSQAPQIQAPQIGGNIMPVQFGQGFQHPTPQNHQYNPPQNPQYNPQAWSNYAGNQQFGGFQQPRFGGFRGGAYFDGNLGQPDWWNRR